MVKEWRKNNPEGKFNRNILYCKLCTTAYTHLASFHLIGTFCIVNYTKKI